VVPLTHGAHMTFEHLTARLAAMRPGSTEPSPDCPDEHLVAGYVDGRLDSAAAADLERHLADCSHCLGLVALLSREHEAGAALTASHAGATSPAILAAARQRRWHGVQKWAVAATLVLAVPVLFQLARAPDREAGEQQAVPSATTRMVTPGAPGLQVLSPSPGSAVDPAQLAFSWTEVPGTPFYDLRIVTDEGDVVVERRVNGTRWQPPTPLRLEPGMEYFVRVEAYPSGDKAVSSHHVPFRVPD
jgi:anti-sigma factor RsiW